MYRLSLVGCLFLVFRKAGFSILLHWILGLTVLTASVENPKVSSGYSTNIGVPLIHTIMPLNDFSKSGLIQFTFSVIKNHCLNLYSVTFSLQIITCWMVSIPCFLQTFIGMVVSCAIAIPRYSHFESLLRDWFYNNDYTYFPYPPLFPTPRLQSCSFLFKRFANNSPFNAATGLPF